MKRKLFRKNEKLAVVSDMESGKTIAQVCREHEVKPEMAYRWKREYDRDPVHAFAGQGNASTADARLAKLERTVGQLYLENEFLKKVHESLRNKVAEAKNKR
jgi:transposase-like protein